MKTLYRKLQQKALNPRAIQAISSMRKSSVNQLFTNTPQDVKSGYQLREYDQGLTADQKKSMKRFEIFRYDPSVNNVKTLMSYYVDLKDCGPMVLDALIKIKDEVDPTLAFRRSCREGICGSCSMAVDGRSTLACLAFIDQDTGHSCRVTPLPFFHVVRDLVVDMTNFYMQYKNIMPVLKRKTPKVN